MRMVPVKRSHSVCAQGGINAANDIARQQGYSEYEHFDETIYGGDFLQHQPPVYEMVHWAPKIIDLLDLPGGINIQPGESNHRSDRRSGQHQPDGPADIPPAALGVDADGESPGDRRGPQPVGEVVHQR